MTDISNEPDDEESLVRFLVYANEYDVEGSSPPPPLLKKGPREDLIHRTLPPTRRCVLICSNTPPVSHGRAP